MYYVDSDDDPWPHIYSDILVAPEPEHTMREVPTHTEDGIPIRKLFIGNLPLKTTRKDLFKIFSRFGEVTNCWVKSEPFKSPQSLTFAFITYNDPVCANRALKAHRSDKLLHGKYLKVLPADSWHQPQEESPSVSYVRHMHGYTEENHLEPIIEQTQASSSAQEECTEECSSRPEPEEILQVQETNDEETNDENSDMYSILEVLNQDCLSHILSYVSLRDLIRSERVSKAWRNMVQEHMAGYRLYKTEWWNHRLVPMTTAVLRHILIRIGPYITGLQVNHRGSILNDRIVNTISKFCPHLEEVQFDGIQTKNWSPLALGCSKLKKVSFFSCNKLLDKNLILFANNALELRSFTLSGNTHVTGHFLDEIKSPNLTSLCLSNCYNLQGILIKKSLKSFPNLKTLKLNSNPSSTWKAIRPTLENLPNLEELSLNSYTSVDLCFSSQLNEDFIEAISKLTELQVLDLSKNVYVNNAVLKQIAKTCTKLRKLDISSCNSRSSFPVPAVSDEGIKAISRSCLQLTHLDISYLKDLTDDGLSCLTANTQLRSLIARGNIQITAAPLISCIGAAHYLQEVDVCGCDQVSSALIESAVTILNSRPRRLKLWLAGTAAVENTLEEGSVPSHKLLTVELEEDRCDPRQRADFFDDVLFYGDDDDDDEDDDNDMDMMSHDDYDFESDDVYEFYLGQDDLGDFNGLIHGLESDFFFI